MSLSSRPTRVLVTGASGFIGSRVIAQLISGGVESHAVSRVSSHVDGATFTHTADLLDRSVMERLVAQVGATHLVHLAWTTEHGAFWSDPANLDWAAASLNLLRRFHQAGGERAVMVGSCAEYDWTQPGPYVENAAGPLPATLYGAAKLGAALSTVSYGAHADLEVAWARLFHLYGPGEPRERLVPQLMAAAAEGRFLDLEHPSQAIDILHVNDVAGALVAMLSSGPTGCVNVGSGVPTTVRELRTKVAAMAGLGSAPTDEIDETARPYVVADVRRLRDEIHYRPARSLEDGLHEIWDQLGYPAKEKL